MKVNSISSFNYNLNRPSFKHTAVPYPEYEYAYDNDAVFVERKLDSVVSKLASLFTPKVTKEAKTIKSDIDSIYANNNSDSNPKKQLLSVVA